eukprot:COSAG02_NODE_368_length_23727_cov_364.814367_11_plen_52_part_00
MLLTRTIEQKRQWLSVVYAGGVGGGGWARTHCHHALPLGMNSDGSTVVASS